MYSGIRVKTHVNQVQQTCYFKNQVQIDRLDLLKSWRGGGPTGSDGPETKSANLGSKVRTHSDL